MAVMRRSQNWDEVASEKQKGTWGRDQTLRHITDTGFSSFDANLHLAVGFLYHLSKTGEVSAPVIESALCKTAFTVARKGANTGSIWKSAEIVPAGNNHSSHSVCPKPGVSSEKGNVLIGFGS